MADPRSREAIAAQAEEVRADLKIWERDFKAAHEGKKANQEDIKERPDIAAKYKEYQRLKNLEADIVRRQNRQQQQERSESKKRKHTSPPGQAHHDINATPRKSAKGLFATPSNNRTKTHPSQLDPYDSPTTFRRLFSPSTHRQSMPPPSPLKAAIGPTPQRDGKALGLFDMISESGGSGSNATPSAKRQKDALGAGFQTPSKPKLFAPIPEAPEEEEEEENSRLSRTPASSSKQFYLANLFATPTTMRYAAMVEKEDEDAAKENTHLEPEAPVSRHSNPSETPSFLRRSNIGRFPPPSAHDGAGLSPIASRKPPQYAGRGLSHLVQGLRAMEEERLEDEWDMLREIEAEQEMMDFEDPEAEPLEQNSKPYKKKGQKRTTRRVIMRPVIPKPKAKTQAPQPEESSDDELAGVPETQFQEVQEVPSDIEEAENDDIPSLHTISEGGSEFGDTDIDSDGDPEYGGKMKAPPRPKSFSERIKEAVSKAEPAVKDVPAKPSPKKAEPEKEEKKPRERKLNPQAHANYRSLKIGNRGGRGRGRFRRR